MNERELKNFVKYSYSGGDGRQSDLQQDNDEWRRRSACPKCQRLKVAKALKKNKKKKKLVARAAQPKSSQKVICAPAAGNQNFS